MEKKIDTLALAAEMIRNLGQEDAARAASMAVQLHQHEQLLGRLDRLGEAVASFAAAQAAADSARADAREERDAAESAARISEIEARRERELAENRRHEEDHQIRLAEIRERAERHGQQGVQNPYLDAVLNRI